jgi:hypothetical protein
VSLINFHIVTPFDVIKTRIQTQTTQEPLFQPSTKSPPDVTCCKSDAIAEKPNLVCQHDPRVEPRSASASTQTRSGSKRSPILSHTEGLANNRAKILRLAPQSSNSMSAIACAFPDRSTAVHELDKSRNSGRMAGLWDGVVKVGRAEGRRGLWRGLTPTL